MNHDALTRVEQQMSSLQPTRAPSELRGVVLADVRRELRAARWDRRLAQAAIVLLLTGVGMNMAIGFRMAGPRDRSALQFVRSSSRQSLVDTAVVVAEATDARTGRQYARQLAAMIGHTLSDDDTAAIDAAVSHSSSVDRNGKKG